MKMQLQNITFYPSIGGIQSYLYNISKRLIEIGHEPTVVCSLHIKTLPRHDTYENIKIIRHPYYKTHVFPFNILSPIYFVKRLEKFLSTNTLNYNVIWSNFFLEAFASCKAFSEKIPVIYIKHAIGSNMIKLHASHLNDKVSLNVYLKSLYPQYFLIEKQAVEESKIVVALSKMRAKEICDTYNLDKNRVTVINPGIDFEKFYPSKKDKDLLKELNLPENCKIILTVCRLSFEKNLEMLINSFKKISNQNVFLIIVGNGAQKEYLEGLVKRLNLSKKVIFTGERSDIERFYRIADLFVLTSIYEGFGLVYLEAMATGIPCIGLKSDYPKIIVSSDEIINDGTTGLLVDPYSVDDLTEKICKIIDDDDLKHKLGKNARKVCEERYSWEKTVEKLLIETEKII